MKKTALLVALSLAVLLGQSAWATITISASPSTQTVAQGGTFNVTFSLAVTGTAGDPANVAGIDLFLQALKSQNSQSDISLFFAIQSQTVTLSGFAAAGPGDYPDTLKAVNSTNHGSNVVENLEDQALSATSGGNVKTVPFATVSFETLNLSVAANTPLGTYTFTTSAPLNTSDARGTHITDSTGAYFIPNTQAIFTITVVPEPATWSLLGLGGLGSLGLTLLRARRKS